MDIKNIVVISISVIIFLIIIIGIAIYAAKGNEVNNLNSLYRDISTLEDNVFIYYLNNGSLPIKDGKIEFDNSINPNDSSDYYEIDIDKLGNLNLAYGSKKNDGDFFIINENSHTIYYYKGISYNGKTYFSKEDSYEYVDLENYK